MSYVDYAAPDEVKTIAMLATGFEQASGFIKVDVDHSVKTYLNFMKMGIGGMLALRNDDGTIIGGLGYVIAPDLHFPKVHAVETFWFVPQENRGDGLKLLIEFEKLAAKKGCDDIAMIHLTDSYPEVLERVYKRRGYQLVEKHYVKEVQP